MHRTHRRLAAILAGAIGLLIVGPTSALADPIAISASPDPVEDAAFQITLSGSGAGHGEAFATVKQAGGRGCGATSSADDGDHFAFEEPASAPFSDVYNRTMTEPGDYLVCAWLQERWDSTTTLVPSVSKVITVRQPRAAGSFSVPARVAAGANLQVTTTVQTEVSRSIYVDVNAPGVPCAANFDANTALKTLIDGQSNLGGPASYPANFTAPEQAGVYGLCGYVQESWSDAASEATFTGQFTVVAPPTPACVAARKHVRSYTSAAKRHTAAARKLAARARRAHGRHRRSLKHKAAVEQRAAKRASSKLKAARRAVGRACPK